MEITLARAWWMLVLRGVVSILIGIIAFMAPFATMRAFILLFGVFAFVHGLFSIGTALRARGRQERWGALLFEGIVGILIAAIAVFMPDVTALVLVLLAATWAIMTGIFEIVTAIHLRRILQREWLLVLAGIFSIVYGALLAIFPVAGAVWFVFLIGAYALIFGVFMTIFGLRMRRWLHNVIPLEPRAA
jgi:uncharacterized membrane protein HdeD (DUF308 family)